MMLCCGRGVMKCAATHVSGCVCEKVCARRRGEREEVYCDAVKASVKATRVRKRTNSLLASSTSRGHGRSFHGLHGDSRGVEANLRLRA